MVKKLWVTAAVVVILGSLGLLLAQEDREEWEFEQICKDLASPRKPPNDTEVVFARIQFTSNGPGRSPFRRRTPCGIWEGWSHDYPVAEQNLTQILHEATRINTRKDSYVMVRLDSDDIFKYPWGLMSEVGEMTLTDKEVVNLREYLNRGGFIVVDDFDGPNLEWFQNQMWKVFPDRAFKRLTVDHPIFHTFYDIQTLEMDPPYRQRGQPAFYGYYDEHGRLCMVLDHNNDLGDFWEWIDEPRYDLAASIAGLRIGVDYFMYALTH